MNLKDKYISETEQSTKPDAKRVTITDEAFAIGELLEDLSLKIEKLRMSFLRGT